ncbi:hypothetical protein AVEN_105770-1 [Araneus ventricosus]|uniref:Uncharacterized protein n=1 Tax=Araneus ventricosus TaxID=182803 RepID=A0A4Y2G0V6_ARAVE|nr:hypothetical protein AVEN_105770-1 [Araneus ventricosus]
MSFQQALLFVALAVIASVLTEANEKVFCNENLMEEVQNVIDDAPGMILDATLKCLKANKPEAQDADVTVDCNGNSKTIEFKYVLGVDEPMQFAECASSAIVDLEDSITDEERKRIDQLQVRALKLYEKIHEMED